MSNNLVWKPVTERVHCPDDKVIDADEIAITIAWDNTAYATAELPPNIRLCELVAEPQPAAGGDPVAPVPGPGNAFGCITPEEMQAQYDALMLRGGPEAAYPIVTATRLARWVEAKYRVMASDALHKLAAAEKKLQERTEWLRDAVEVITKQHPDAPVPLDAPDEVDCDYWFDGSAAYREQMLYIQGSVYVRINTINKTQYVHYGSYVFNISGMRGKWYKRDLPPWHGEKEGGE